MVKRSRVQSQDTPRRRSWVVMVLPYSAFHSQTFSKKASRPSARRSTPSALSLRVTIISVAMPA